MRMMARLTYRCLYATLSYSRQAPRAPQSELQKRQVESIPAPNMRGGGMNPVQQKQTEPTHSLPKNTSTDNTFMSNLGQYQRTRWPFSLVQCLEDGGVMFIHFGTQRFRFIGTLVKVLCLPTLHEILAPFESKSFPSTLGKTARFSQRANSSNKCKRKFGKEKNVGRSQREKC